MLLPNRHVIHCDRGWLAYHYDVADRFYWGWPGSPTANCVMLGDAPADRPLWDFPDARLQVSDRMGAAFVAQHRNITGAIRGTAELVVTARQAAAGIAVLERCYASRRLMSMPWLDADERVRAAHLEREVAG